MKSKSVLQLLREVSRELLIIPMRNQIDTGIKIDEAIKLLTGRQPRRRTP